MMNFWHQPQAQASTTIDSSACDAEEICRDAFDALLIGRDGV
ncbi:hypothetical protein [Methylobacterium sp. E-005]|nr:hypothetical protein [Methylobacterium sp. E-005]